MKKKFNQLAGILICITFAVVLLFLKDKANVIWNAICTVASILTPFVYGFGLAYILNFPYRFFKNKVFSKLKGKWADKSAKPLSLITTYILFLGLLSFLISILIPQLTENINNLVTSLPGYLDTFSTNIENAIIWINTRFGVNITEILGTQISELDNLSELIIEQVSSLFAPEKLEALTNAVYGTAMFFYNWIMAFIISIYMLLSKEILLAQVKRFCIAFLPTMWMPKLYRIVDVTDNKCGKFLVGKILDSTIIGVICFLAMVIMGIPYAPLISVFVGVTNIIPFFGPFIGAIPSAVILLFVSPFDCLKFVIMVFILQQIDGNFIGPKVVGSQVGLIGFWSLFSVVVAGGLFGVTGLILGTPIFAAVYTLLGDKVAKRIENKGEAAEAVLEMPVINSSDLTNLKAGKSIKIKRKKKNTTEKIEETDENAK